MKTLIVAELFAVFFFCNCGGGPARSPDYSQAEAYADLHAIIQAEMMESGAIQTRADSYEVVNLAQQFTRDDLVWWKAFESISVINLDTTESNQILVEAKHLSDLWNQDVLAFDHEWLDTQQARCFAAKALIQNVVEPSGHFVDQANQIWHMLDGHQSSASQIKVYQ